jgi:hypothetical protein
MQCALTLQSDCRDNHTDCHNVIRTCGRGVTFCVDTESWRLSVFRFQPTQSTRLNRIGHSSESCRSGDREWAGGGKY